MIQVSILSALRRQGRKALAWLGIWWQIARFSVVVLTFVFLPSTYNRTNRIAIAQQIVRATVPNLMWFTVLSALISVVLIRIVVVTARSYGLSQFAIEMVVRVLVLELIPLTAALFVALRYTLPGSVEVEHMRMQSDLETLSRQGTDPIRHEFLPRVLAAIFSVWLLGAVTCIMTLVLAYQVTYGFTPWALAGYTRVVGQVFNTGVAMILVLKIFFFSLAVSFIPMASAYYDGMHVVRDSKTTSLAAGLAGMVRLFVVVLAIEVISLIGNYY